MRDGIAPPRGRSALGTEDGAAGKQLLLRPDLQLVEEPLLPVYGLRLSRKQGRELAQRFVESCGLRLPATPNTVDGSAALGVAWVEPNAWLLLGAGMPAALNGVQPPAGLYLTELSARFCVLRVSGTSAARLLASSLSLDLSDQSFPEGCCARARFAELGGVYLQRIGGGYRIAIDVGLGPCLAEWLGDAARLIGAPGPGALS